MNTEFVSKQHEEITNKEVRALRCKFCPLLSQKLKGAFRENHSIGLLEEQLKCKI